MARTVGTHTVSEAIGCAEWTLRQAVNAGRSPVPVIRVGRLIRFPLAGLANVLGEDVDELAERLGLTDDNEDAPTSAEAS